MKYFVVLASLFVSFGVSAAKLEWTRWHPSYRYVDREVNCSTAMQDHVFFGVQRGASGVTYAEFRDEVSDFSQSYSPIPAALLPSIEVNGLVKRLTLSANALNWILVHKNSMLWECQPPVALKDIAPGSVVLDFQPTLDDSGKAVWRSQEVKYFGHRSDGLPFQLTLSFRQYQL